MARARRGPRRGALRVNGLLALVALVAIGLGAGAGYYRFEQPRMEAELQRKLAAAPTTQEGRLEQWIAFGAPQIHHRLSVVARVSRDRPWLVTHTLGDPAGADPPRVWGIDVGELPKDLCRREGMTVVVELPGPRLLGRAALAGENARHVPNHRDPERVPDPAVRLEELALWFLSDLIRALERDIEGAVLEVRVGGT